MHKYDDIIDKLKELRNDITNGALIVETETEFEELIKIKDIDDELYETLILIYTRNKNKLLTVKNSYTKNTLAIIDMNITIIEAVMHKSHPNHNTTTIDSNSVQHIQQPVTTQPTPMSSWSDLLLPNNIFKIGSIFILLILMLWTMFLISPKATEDTVSSINKVIETTNKK